MLLVLSILVEIGSISSCKTQVAAHSSWLAILSLVCRVQYVIVSHFSISALLVILIPDGVSDTGTRMLAGKKSVDATTHLESSQHPVALATAENLATDPGGNPKLSV